MNCTHATHTHTQGWQTERHAKMDEDEDKYEVDEENSRKKGMRKRRMSQKLADEEEKEVETIWKERKTGRIRTQGRNTQAHKNRRKRA